jgi:DNA-binding transcriptional ArsR family regulator
MNLVFRALADPTRRQILELLRARNLSAGEIAEHFDLSKPTLSGHFAILRDAGLVTSEKSGTTITYRLNISVLEDALLGFADIFGIGQPKTRRTRPARGTL